MHWAAVPHRSWQLPNMSSWPPRWWDFWCVGATVVGQIPFPTLPVTHEGPGRYRTWSTGRGTIMHRPLGHTVYLSDKCRIILLSRYRCLNLQLFDKHTELTVLLHSVFSCLTVRRGHTQRYFYTPEIICSCLANMVLAVWNSKNDIKDAVMHTFIASVAAYL